MGTLKVAEVRRSVQLFQSGNHGLFAGEGRADRIGPDLAPKFYPVLSSLQRFWVAVFGAVAAVCGAEPFRLRSAASRRGSIV